MFKVGDIITNVRMGGTFRILEISERFNHADVEVVQHPDYTKGCKLRLGTQNCRLVSKSLSRFAQFQRRIAS